MGKTIRNQLTLWYIVLLALILLGFSGALYATLEHALYRQVDDSLERNAHDLADGLNIVHDQIEYPGGENDAKDFEAVRAQGYLVRILNVNGTILTSNTTYAPISIEANALAAEQRGLSRFQTVFANGNTYRLYTLPVQMNQRTAGAIQLAEGLGEVEATLRELVFVLALIVPLTLAFATFGGRWLAWRALRPSDQITRTTQTIGAHDLSQRLRLKTADDEVGRLAHTINAMLARLDAAFRREREFTANAAHELRTPLTVMRGEIDVVLQRPRERGDYIRALNELGTSVEQLSHVTDDLLLLARADAGQVAIGCEELDAALLLHAVAEQLRPVALAQRISLDVRADPTLRFWGDEVKLLRALFNLVDNALAFAPPDTPVLLAASRRGDRVHLCVSDQGPGIAAPALPYIFERFYRGANGRAGGSGLGLAIARAFVQAQGGSISAHSEMGRLTTFTIEMPTHGL